MLHCCELLPSLLQFGAKSFELANHPLRLDTDFTNFTESSYSEALLLVNRNIASALTIKDSHLRVINSLTTPRAFDELPITVTAPHSV